MTLIYNEMNQQMFLTHPQLFFLTMNLEKKYDNYNNIVLALTKQYTNFYN